MPVSVIVPIRNEAQNLARCLASVGWADEIFVVDSESTDGSQRIAEEFGARVVQFEFNGTWPKKKNWALENLPFPHEWVFIVDADEVLPRGSGSGVPERDREPGEPGDIGSIVASCSWAGGCGTPIIRTGTCGSSVTG